MIGRGCSQLCLHRLHAFFPPSRRDPPSAPQGGAVEAKRAGSASGEAGSARVQDCKKLAATPTWRNALQSAPRQNLASGQSKIEPHVFKKKSYYSMSS